MEDDFRGTVTFGLIQGMESLTGNVVAELTETYVICEHQIFPLLSSVTFTLDTSVDRFGEIVSFVPIYFTLLCAVIAISLCIAAASFTFVNTYQVVEQWWKGPATVYVLSFLISK